MSGATPAVVSPRPARWMLRGLLAAVLLAHLPLLTDHPTGAHTWRMADTAAMARHFVEDRFDLLHPRIDWDRGESGRVQTELPLYTWALAGLWAVTGEHMATAQLLALLLSLGALGCFFGFAREVMGERRALLGTLLLASTPLVFYFTMSVQPESLLLLLSYGALWAWAAWLRGRSGRALAAWAGALALAAGVKPQTLLLLVPMALMAGARPDASPRWGKPLGALAAALVLPAVWYWHGHGIYLDTHNSFGITTSGGLDKFSMLLRLRQPLWWRVIAHDLASYTWLLPAVPFLVAGTLRAWRTPGLRFLVAWTVAVLLSFAVLAEATWTMSYYQLPLAGPTALLGALGLEAAWERVRRAAAGTSARGIGAGGVALALAVAAVSAGLAGAWGLLDRWVEALSGGGAVAGLLRLRGIHAEGMAAVARHALHTASFQLVGWGLVLGGLLAALRPPAPRPGERRAVGVLGAVALMLLAAWPLAVAGGMRKLWRADYGAQYLAGRRLQALFPPETLGILGHQVYKRPHDYDPEPVIFYYGGMRGWIIPERDYRPSLLDSLVDRGARFFATTHLGILDRNPAFVAALERRGRLEERAVEYAIYRLGVAPTEGP